MNIQIKLEDIQASTKYHGTPLTWLVTCALIREGNNQVCTSKDKSWATNVTVDEDFSTSDQKGMGRNKTGLSKLEKYPQYPGIILIPKKMDVDGTVKYKFLPREDFESCEKSTKS